VAVALSRLGIPSAFCGAIGDDPFGIRLQNVLRADGVDIENLTVFADENTTLAFAWKDERGDGLFRILRMADTRLSAKAIDAAKIPDRAAILLGSVVLTEPSSRDAAYRAAALARNAGVPVVFDVNIRASLWENHDAARTCCQPILEAATIVKLSLDDAAFLFDTSDPDRVFSLAENSQIWLVTDGSRGAWFKTDNGLVEHVAAFPIEPIEPTGAGDAFTASIVYRYLERGTPPNREDVLFASAAGAITATRIGAIESLPTRAEIEQVVARGSV
jgi:sugar/nucleoside kinase (ribokinase family)